MRLPLIVFFVLLSIGATAQQLNIKRATSPVVIDGKMDEAVWSVAEPADQFSQFFPSDSVPAVAQSEVRMTYDDENIYVLAIMHNLGPRKYVAPSLRRDFRGEGNDGITIVLDTFRDRTNAFMFGVNPFGVQREGLISNGGVSGEDLSLDWDNKWYAEAKVYDNYWIAEMAIPFKTIRFNEGELSWYVNFYRIDSKYAERSTWAPIPQNFDILSLAFGRELMWDQPLKKAGTNLSVIPYVSAGNTKNFSAGTPADREMNAGFDAKVAVSSSLNLDITVNPDFSQVEVDAQVTNLDRFEIFFPERRQFFLENADLFSSFGVEGTRPFFSRRIGVARDTASGQNVQNTIYGGVRLSGKIGNNWRVGLLSMQAGEDRQINLPSTNFTVGTVQRKVFSRSNIGFIVINKQAFQDSISGAFTSSPAASNRLAGLDFNLASKNNVWNGKVFYHQSFDQQKLDSAFARGLTVEYNTLRWFVSVFSREVGANYNPEVGFVRRRDIRQLASTTWYSMYPSSGPVQSHGPGFDFDMVGNDRYGFLDWDMNLMYQMRFRNTAYMNVRLRKEYTYLFDEFDPSGTGGTPLAAGTDFTNYLFVSEFYSDVRKPFFLSLSTRSGGYFRGTRLNLGGSFTYRYIPWGFVSLNFELNRIQQPAPYADADLVLLGPRVDLTLSRKVFFTTFVQYNSQLKNLNINSRLQWRFRPVSDIFLVYTDNYVTESYTNREGVMYQKGDPRLRGIVFKISYWLNM